MTWEGLAARDGAGHRVTHNRRRASGSIARSIPDDGATRDGIPVTSLHRTHRRPRTAPQQPRTQKGDLGGRRAAACPRPRCPLRRGHGADSSAEFSTTYVAGRGLTDSELEARFFEHRRDPHVAAAPEMQRRKAGGRVDFVWPELG